MTVAKSFDFVERRAQPRKKGCERGTIYIGASGRGCLVLDRSPGGARIELGAEFPLPLRFELQLGTSRRAIPVQVIWQKGLVAGIRFDGVSLWRRLLDLTAMRGKRNPAAISIR